MTSDVVERLERWSSETINQWADEYEPKPAWEKQVSQAMKKWSEASDEAAALISSLVAENEALSAKFNGIQTCGCAWDSPDDICSCHSPQLAAAQASHKAARENFLTMQQAAAVLLKRAETAERALKLMFNAYEGVSNCVDKAGKHYRDDEAIAAEEAARATLSTGGVNG